MRVTRSLHPAPRALVAGCLAATAILVALGASSRTSAATPAHPCEPGDVEVVAGQGGFGLGHWRVPLLILDPGGRTCTFRGYPTVRAFTTTKHWVVAYRSPSGYMGGLGQGQQLHTVTLNAYRVASTLLEGTDNPVNGATSCPTYVRIEVTLPTWRQPVANLPLDNLACSQLEVHPVVNGPTGNQPPIE